ncbi:MAG: Asp-tRNA(Asn)/Glu-tRNA(Gln) amidotransferase subunit GatC [Rothia sp. (in: high G+C Gram-positive bacteria)]|uniref:Asp-tRNA(Asn)/Glu-tRNA(Gln) amidotransferase subunit GatC n=1 Tax=Rothia sp. (in: high G+C Gram-positive bacteria) TaxID=1885016 RepID=UPI0026DD69BC|nr:Asp-tRNA(Asn)/Glu-tRNA(Gln) amidotransferase subunit GatC [Rothia sp. (in: high G+C Gram-positive bacteria)]MDO4884050.1 Asp-tRNA(Asn)/Glu-tRNA(Gln) amidotransferase subunit GatC [Rothia sp. (in: high G+C Gram-positive bacteria)]
MSAITPEQVKHLAELARIEMTDDELAAMAAELDIIVSSVENLSEIVTSDTPATSHPIPLTNVFREDVVGHTLTQEEALSGAPDAQDGKFRVPAILDED